MTDNLLLECERMKHLAGVSSVVSKKSLQEYSFTREELLQNEEPEKSVEEIIYSIDNEEIENKETLNPDVKSAEEISDNAENLYPGTKYKGMYTGEHMMEEISSFDNDTELIIDENLLN